MNCLSELMEKGMAVMKERGMVQARGFTISEGAACMTGAILLGIKPDYDFIFLDQAIAEIYSVCPAILEVVDVPDYLFGKGKIYSLLVNLNDTQGWTLEQGLAYLKEHNL